MPGSHSLRCSFMGSAGFRKMKALEITAKLQTATMELVPNGPTTCTRYVYKVRVIYVSSDNLRCWPGTCSSNMNMFFIITLRDYFVHLPKTCFGIQRIILKLGVGFLFRSLPKPSLWNSLSQSVKDSASLDPFKSTLKKHLFLSAYYGCCRILYYFIMVLLFVNLNQF